MSIEGIPKDWDLIGIRYARENEYFINNEGKIEKWTLSRESDVVLPIICKKPKQYRPFANAAEFEPHRDRWIRRSSKHDTPDTIPAGCFKVTAYNDHHYWTVDGSYTSYEQAFNDNKCFDDGTPFGIEVTE